MKTMKLMPTPIVVMKPVDDADPGAEHRGNHRQGEQPVRVAQHAVALLHAGDCVTEIVRLQGFVHESSEGKTTSDS